MSKIKEYPTQTQLKQVFSCDGENFYWKEKPHRRIDVTKPAGCINKTIGYRRIGISRKLYRVSSLVWIFFRGDIPDGMEVENIDNNRLNDHIENLRLVTCTGNHRNQSLSKNNTSGVIGVSWRKSKKKWRVRIGVNGRNTEIGYFKNKEDAVEARKRAEIKYGFHPNHGVSV